MEENQTEKLFSAGYAGMINGGNPVPNEYALFYEKEPDGSVDASNLYILTAGKSDKYQPAVCARFAAKKVLYEYFHACDYIEANKLALSMRTANNEIKEYAEVKNEEMGASILTAAVADGKVVIGNVGGSHAYIIRNGKVFQITENSRGEGESGQTAIPYLGAEKDIVIDIYDGIEVRAGDVVLLCCENLDTFIGKREMLNAADLNSPREIVEAILKIPETSGNPICASAAAIRIYDRDCISNVLREEGCKPVDADLSAEEKEVKTILSIKRKRSVAEDQNGKKDKLPLILAAVLLALLLISGIVFGVKGGFSQIFPPKNTPTPTIDYVRETVTVLQLTMEAEKEDAVAATIAALPTQTPYPTATPIYFDLDATIEAIQQSLLPTETVAVLNEQPAALAEIPADVEPVVANDVSGESMVYIPAGTFILGSDPAVDGYTSEEEKPQLEVYLDAFRIGKYEVTNKQYRACVEAGVCQLGGYMNLYTSGYEQKPVTYVTIDQAKTYCKWIGGRLPTEFEWEKAARGANGNIYPWGDEEPNEKNGLANVPYYEGDSKYENDIYPVGKFPNGASPYGVEDMAGNVWEWTSTWYSDDTYETLSAEAGDGEIRNPQGPEYGDAFVMRGGSCSSTESNNYLIYLRGANRSYVNLSSSYFIGFRCVTEE